MFYILAYNGGIKKIKKESAAKRVYFAADSLNFKEQLIDYFYNPQSVLCRVKDRIR